MLVPGRPRRRCCKMHLPEKEAAGPLSSDPPPSRHPCAAIFLLLPHVERVNEIGRQGVLAVPQMLRAGRWVEAIVVEEKVLAGIVMPVFQPGQQSRHIRYLIGDCLSNFPQRLRGPGTRSVLVIEEFAARCRF